MDQVLISALKSKDDLDRTKKVQSLISFWDNVKLQKNKEVEQDFLNLRSFVRSLKSGTSINHFSYFQEIIDSLGWEDLFFCACNKESNVVSCDKETIEKLQCVIDEIERILNIIKQRGVFYYVDNDDLKDETTEALILIFEHSHMDYEEDFLVRGQSVVYVKPLMNKRNKKQKLLCFST